VFREIFFASSFYPFHPQRRVLNFPTLVFNDVFFSDPELLETVSRTSLASKWVVALRSPSSPSSPSTPAAETADESGLVMVLEGKGVGLGEVDGESSLHCGSFPFLFPPKS